MSRPIRKENNMEKIIAGYRVTEFGVLQNAPCACYGCYDRSESDGKIERGHAYCSHIPQALLDAEERGEIHRQLDGYWVWVVS
jgi:hypothetical protein